MLTCASTLPCLEPQVVGLLEVAGRLLASNTKADADSNDLALSE